MRKHFTKLQMYKSARVRLGATLTLLPMLVVMLSLFMPVIFLFVVSIPICIVAMVVIIIGMKNLSECINEIEYMAARNSNSRQQELLSKRFK